MFLLKEPTSEIVQQFISSQQGSDYSYAEIGATRDRLPAGYKIDHNRIQLGSGPEVFALAVEAIKAWRQFDLDWVRIVPAGVEIEVGATVAVLTRHFGFWSLNAARLVYVIDEVGSRKRYGFAYGTLAEHAECGEELFTVELHSNGMVWYDILAFSRPNQLIVKLALPLARLLQKRFARDSLAVMAAIVKRNPQCLTVWKL